VFSYSLDDDLFIPVNIKNTSFSKDSDTKNFSELAGKKYHLIVGCFGQKENASALVSELKEEGYDSFILDLHKGLHRVSAAQSESRKDAKRLNEKIKASGRSSWVLKK
jgi:cell division septation protein DedD